MLGYCIQTGIHLINPNVNISNVCLAEILTTGGHQYVCLGRVHLLTPPKTKYKTVRIGSKHYFIDTWPEMPQNFSDTLNRDGGKP